jgi:hypothetical protein
VIGRGVIVMILNDVSPQNGSIAAFYAEMFFRQKTAKIAKIIIIK